MQMTELFERFLAFERREGMMDRRIGGVPYWHLVRMPVFRSLLDGVLVLKPAHPDFSVARAPQSRMKRVVETFRAIWRRILDSTVRNPLLAVRRRPVLFSMTPRQAVLSDGRKASLLLDFFAPLLRSRYALLEYVLTEPTDQPFFRKVFHLPRMARSFGKCRSGGWFADVSAQSRTHSEMIAGALSAEFGMVTDAGFIAAQIEGALLYREVYKPVFHRMLSRMHVRVLVTAVHYNLLHFTLAEAAHELGVTVVELQHGTIYKSHAAYNLPSPGSVYSPDYLVTWGEYWSRQTRNYPGKSSVPAGYPYLERMFSEYGNIGRSDSRCTVLFISQANVADGLVDAACELRLDLPEKGFRVVYKLHPNESLSWKSLYPKLAASSVDVVSNDEKNIYACLAEADVVVGSCSTSLVEGAARGLRTLVLHWLPGADTMQGFVDSGLMQYVDTGAELCDALLGRGIEAEEKPDVGVSLFALPGSADAIAAFLDGLIDGSVPQSG